MTTNKTRRTYPGICCPDCGSKKTPVKFTRRVGTIMKRSRACRECGRRFSTSEKIINEVVPAKAA